MHSPRNANGTICPHLSKNAVSILHFYFGGVGAAIQIWKKDVM